MAEPIWVKFSRMIQNSSENDLAKEILRKFKYKKVIIFGHLDNLLFAINWVKFQAKIKDHKGPTISKQVKLRPFNLL